MSAMVMDIGGLAPLADFQDTILPSADTATVPSCFLNWAAALDMLVEERWCHNSQSREPQMCIITTSPHTTTRPASPDLRHVTLRLSYTDTSHEYSITPEH
jgi:hypothetical protein